MKTNPPTESATFPTERRRFLRNTLATLLGASALSQIPNHSFADDPKSSTPAEPLLSVHDHNMHWPPGWTGNEQIVMLLYPGFTALDLFGPHHMFVLMMGAKVHLAAKTLDPVVTDTGIEVRPTISFQDAPERPTILFVPGGTGGTLDAAKDEVTRNFVAEKGKHAEFVTSVCTGSVLLGAAGLLEGYKATSHWITRDLLSEFGATPVDQRVVVDRNRITGAGVTSGLDFGLQMVKDLRNEEYAEAVQLFAEYDPQPPMDKGCEAKADPQISGLLMHMHEPFRQMVKQLAE
ncbi:Isonitrile hydratase [Roseimaritima multifibrata]|uniref:Isonitrile hydratase n=1 Tax=Roseimaritima multifibrata TaxID=1930274 RepID=A0A517MHP6_9BACT|nr:DJ-1/PfpI family protein [Roseimaritima multifibrata]QDS94405.1 Isonitrile hydratase [Roseimaritima multifibrata]